MTENKILKCSICKAGGNAGSGSRNYKVTLPPSWMKQLGVAEGNRELAVEFDGEKILIKKLDIGYQ